MDDLTSYFSKSHVSLTNLATQKNPLECELVTRLLGSKDGSGELGLQESSVIILFIS